MSNRVSRIIPDSTAVLSDQDVFSPLFLDYLQLWIPIPYEIFSHDLMLNMAEAFCGSDDGYYPPKSVRMDTKRDQIYINMVL